MTTPIRAVTAGRNHMKTSMAKNTRYEGIKEVLEVAELLCYVINWGMPASCD